MARRNEDWNVGLALVLVARYLLISVKRNVISPGLGWIVMR
jgi:hypothetical protein